MSAGGRTGWVDVAKGVSIVLVVLNHVLLAFVAQGWAPEAAERVSATLGTLRMPLFFLASGIFATRALAGPWGRLAERRVAFFAWLYVLWCLIQYLWFGLVAHGADLGSWPSPWTAVTQLWLPHSAMWFIYALALFSVIGRATRAVPAWIRVGAAAALSAVVGSGLVHVDSYAWRAMGINLVFFLLGADASVGIRRAAAALSRRAAVGLAVVATIGFVALSIARRDPDMAAVPGLRLVTSVVALAAGIALAVAVADTRADRVPRWLGSRTLDVYVLHGLVLALLVRVGTAAHLGELGSAAGTSFALATTAVVVVACLVTARGLRGLGAGWLFAPPWHGRALRAAPADADRRLPAAS
jgi:uncharacterized membrane protein YcfT